MATTKTYTGPSVAEMIATHTLAENIMKHHNHPHSDSIMDDENLAMLRRFVKHPEQRDDILHDAGIEQDPDTNPYSGSLAGYVVLKDGHGDVLSKQEMESLKQWFETGNVLRE